MFQLVQFYRGPSGKACAALLADAGGRASDASAVRCNDATDCAVVPSGELATGPKYRNLIAENEGGGIVSEKSTKHALEIVAEPRMAKNRSVIRIPMQVKSSETGPERYTSRVSVLKGHSY
jgi:hypothetical protein